MGLAESRILAGARLALSVGYQVAAFGKDVGGNLPHLVENEQVVIVQDAYAFKAVVRRPPRPHMGRPAPHGRRHLQARCFPAGASAFKGKAAALHIGQTQERPGKGRA